MALQHYKKDPEAVLDYGFDWQSADLAANERYLDSGEEITVHVWTVPTGLTKDSQVDGTTVSKVWLSGGTVGATYTVECKITTDAGRTDERSFTVEIVEK